MMDSSPENWERIKSLFEQALEHDPESRINFLLDRAKTPALREEVLRLLAEYDRAGSFLSKPAYLESEKSGQRRLRPGDLLDSKFKIIEKIGEGGMGEVYRACDTRLDRDVAVKVLPPHLSQNTELRIRFEREAKVISSLQHPNICVLHDVGHDAEVYFLVMEYLKGETLAARIRKGPLQLDEAINISITVADALGATHLKGIVHRDLKPGNIMLSDNGVKLLDFGIAKYERPVMADETKTALTGDAQLIGTLPYMAPEQLQGKPADIRTDIFAFGAVLYEMLTGQRAFQYRAIGNITGSDRDDPKPLRQFVNNVPEDLERIVWRCLRKRPEDRYASMSQIERELQDCRSVALGPDSGINLKVLVQRSKRPDVAIPVLLILVMIATFFAWSIHRNVRIKWARDQALPQIAEFIEKDKISDAFALSLQAEHYIPRDPILAKYWPEVSWSEIIKTTPAGASVFRQDYNRPDDKWEFIGLTPIENRRFPLVDSRWKFELKGFRAIETATFPAGSMTLKMEEESKAPPGMVRVDSHSSESLQTEPIQLWGIAGFEALPPVAVKDYWIDKFEVTNRDFKRFVDQGGYRKAAYWKQEIRRTDGKLISFSDAMKLFVDKTGLNGPATWVQGEYPRGQDELPVTGVSWFEAAAYAEFVGKSLPTIYHWTLAASPWDSASIIPASNFNGRGPAPVGTYRGTSWSGVYDMAGNVKEWILNEGGAGKRYIMGGAWDEPAYMFNDADARSPFERFPNFGFRCAIYVLNGEEGRASDPVKVQIRNYSVEKPVSDQIFQAYRGLYSYDKAPLHPVIESGQQTEDSKLEKISFDAAYGGERITAYLYLPTKGSPPYQTVVYFPGAGAAHLRSSADSLSMFSSDFDFIIKSGRAVIFPVYEGTFERGAGPKTTYWPNTSSAYRDHVLAWSKDLGRSIDYLETRHDIDHDKLAYEGASWGAAMGALFPAVDGRFKALVLLCPGFYLQNRLPEVDQLNFAPRVKTPALMLSGRYDYIFPVISSQEPMFRLLGTRKEDKRRVVYETGHDIPQNEEIKETLKWLDRYLGQVK